MEILSISHIIIIFAKIWHYAQKRLSFLTAIQETTIRLHTSLK